MVGAALLGARKPDELVGHEALAKRERRPAPPVAEPEDEALERAAALGTRERGVDAEAITADGARHQLEGVAGARPPKAVSTTISRRSQGASGSSSGSARSRT